MTLIQFGTCLARKCKIHCRCVNVLIPIYHAAETTCLYPERLWHNNMKTGFYSSEIFSFCTPKSWYKIVALKAYIYFLLKTHWWEMFESLRDKHSSSLLLENQSNSIGSVIVGSNQSLYTHYCKTLNLQDTLICVKLEIL